MGIVDEYLELKDSTESDLLAMQVGDFYEFFGDDARTVSDELGLKISEKSSHGSSYAMAGVPINDIDQYVHNLVDKFNYTVSIADQYKEDGSHQREVSRIVTPGTLINNFGGDPKYLASVYISEDNAGISFTNVTSGRIYVTKCDHNSILKNLSIYEPDEIIIDRKNINIDISDIIDSINTYFDTKLHQQNNYPNYKNAKMTVQDQFGNNIEGSIGVTDSNSTVSISMILKYLNKTGQNTNSSITKISEIGNEDYVKMDARTRRSLEIINTMSFESGISLFDVMDKTQTSMGSDLLKRRLQRPLSNKSKITRRQDSISFLVQNAILRDDIRGILESTPNIQRISSRATNGTATPNDIYNIIDSIDSINEIRNVLSKYESNSEIQSKFLDFDTGILEDIYSEIKSAIVEDPPSSVKSGMIKYGYSKELDNLIDKYNSHMNWIENLESELSSEYNLSHVSVGRNKTDGYYIQVGNSEEDEVPSKYNKIKSLKNSVRFKNEEINRREEKILRLEEKRENLEKDIFRNVVEKVSNKSEYLQNIGDLIAEIDSLQSLAKHSVKNSWVKPKIKEQNMGINIKSGRHPVVEQTVDFVPNDTDIGRENRMMIVTGPNMAGKSTYLRQTALIVLLAQIGCYIPAKSAQIGIVDGIFTRIGSLDEISQGRSTFMVEMSELANILHRSTDHSLVILDEVGRGTATYDGISISQSTIEYLTENDKGPTPMTLFATHYHELTQLSKYIKSIKNVHIAVDSKGDDYKFLRKVRDGPADESYGIKVADMAGVPNPVIDRSEELINNLTEQDSKFNLNDEP